jgi:uncharacterized protein YecE (DUF72 family)
MQDSLFPSDFDGLQKPAAERPSPSPATTDPKGAKPKAREVTVRPQTPSLDDVMLAQNLSTQVRLGTSSWGFPGWSGLVWDKVYAQALLSRQGLSAYAHCPLFRTVSLDRAFYRPLSAAEYAALAAQVPPDFRFVVKAPSLVTDAMVRARNGRGMELNSSFLDPAIALRDFVQPVLDGLGEKAGALVFQLSPLPASLMGEIPELLERMSTMLHALPVLSPIAPEGVIAVEVRNPELIGPELAAVLREAGATYCLGLHAKMPPIEAQLPILRALWPGPLVCRWNLHRRHGAYGYEEAKDLYAPFDKIVDADPDTRTALARVITATATAGHPVYVTINNKAEGSAPMSVKALAELVSQR